MNLEIKRQLEQAAKFIQNKGYYPIYIALFGSQNYGLDVHNDEYKSDFDFKCIIAPTLADLVMKRAPTSVVLDYNSGHIDVKDIREYMRTLRKANPAYIEPLVTPFYLCLNEGVSYMPDIRNLISDLVLEESFVFINACKGLFYEKLSKMSHPYPTKIELIEKYGYDGKQVSHMLRILLMLKAFMLTGTFQLNPPPEYIRQLIDLKLNKYTLEEATIMAKEWAIELEHICKEYVSDTAKSKLRFDAADKIMNYAYRIMFDFCLAENGKGEQKLTDIQGD